MHSEEYFDGCPCLAACPPPLQHRNYADRTCELTKFFQDEIYSVAVHPTGLSVSVIV